MFHNYTCEGQLNIFDFLAPAIENMMEEIKEVSREDKINGYLEEAVLRGSGFEDGKYRICEFFKNIPNAADRAKAIKNEYGIGGWLSKNGIGLCGGDTLSNGLKIEFIEEDGEHSEIFSWVKVEKVIGKLIKEGKYIGEKRE